MDPEDPSVIAEKELLGAANSIEAAAKKLAQLQPRAQPKVTNPQLSMCVSDAHITCLILYYHSVFIFCVSHAVNTLAYYSQISPRCCIHVDEFQLVVEFSCGCLNLDNIV